MKNAQKIVDQFVEIAAAVAMGAFLLMIAIGCLSVVVLIIISMLNLLVR